MLKSDTLRPHRNVVLNQLMDCEPHRNTRLVSSLWPWCRAFQMRATWFNFDASDVFRTQHIHHLSDPFGFVCLKKGSGRGGQSFRVPIRRVLCSPSSQPPVITLLNRSLLHLQSFVHWSLSTGLCFGYSNLKSVKSSNIFWISFCLHCLNMLM